MHFHQNSLLFTRGKYLLTHFQFTKTFFALFVVESIRSLPKHVHIRPDSLAQRSQIPTTQHQSARPYKPMVHRNHPDKLTEQKLCIKYKYSHSYEFTIEHTIFAAFLISSTNHAISYATVFGIALVTFPLIDNRNEGAT